MAKDDPGPLAREVERRMKAKGFQQKGLATAAGLNDTYVRDILKGKSKNPRHEHLAKLAEALDCTIADLTGAGVPSTGQGVSDRDGPLAANSGQLVSDPSELFLLDAYREFPEERRVSLRDYVGYLLTLVRPARAKPTRKRV